MSKIRVAIVVDRFLPGISGMVTAVRNSAETLRRAGNAVTLIAPGSAETEQWAKNCGVEFYPMRSLLAPGGQRIGVWLPATRRAKRALLQDVDVVHLHSPFLAGLAIAKLARKERIPIVLTNHILPENIVAALGIPYHYGMWQLSAALWTWMGAGIRLADALTSPSPYGARLIRRRFGKSNVHVISNGVKQPSRQVRCREDVGWGKVFRALYVGRLQREKNVDELLHAVLACRQAGIAVELTLVGDGPDRRRLEAVSRQLQIGEYVIFAGAVSESRRDDYYASSHFLWMASRAELQCCAALEAMAAGRAVIAARAGALAETVPEGIAGRLYTPGNVREIVEILREFRRDPSLYGELCRGASAEAENHWLKDVGRALVEVYASVITRSRDLSPVFPAVETGASHVYMQTYPAVSKKPERSAGS